MTSHTSCRISKGHSRFAVVAILLLPTGLSCSCERTPNGENEPEPGVDAPKAVADQPELGSSPSIRRHGG